MSRENEKVDVLFFRLPLHGELPVRHNLRAVHNDLRSVLMRQSGDTVHVCHISRHIGSRCHGNILHVVLLQQPFDLVIPDPAQVIHFRVDYTAAFTPGEVVGMMLDARCQNKIIFAFDQGRGKLVQAVGCIVDIKTGVFR